MDNTTKQITAPAAKIRAWRTMRENNDTTDELVEMAQWLKHEIGERIRPAKFPARPNPGEGIYNACANILECFAAIRAIHHAEGSLPYRVYQYRYDLMARFLALAGKVSPDLEAALTGCL